MGDSNIKRHTHGPFIRTICNIHTQINMVGKDKINDRLQKLFARKRYIKIRG